MIGAFVSLLAVSCGGDNSAKVLPVADAGFDRTVRVSSTVNLSAEASSDPDGRPLSYHWRLLATPQASQTTLIGAELSAATFVADVEGSFLLSLTVTAGDDESLPDVLVVSARNQPPVALASCIPANCTVLHGRQLDLDGRNSNDPDGDDVLAGAVFSQVLTCSECPTVSTCSPTAPSVTLSPTASPGVVRLTAPQVAEAWLTFKLAVSDGVDSATTCTAVHVTNTPPQAVLPPASGSTNPTSVSSGATFFLSGTGSADYDLDPVTYAWSQTAGSAASLSGNEGIEVMATAPTVASNETLTFRFTISDGVASDSETISVLVTP